MKNWLLPILFCFFLINLYAQNGAPSIAGARGLALGNTGLTFKDIHSSFRNQAGLAFLPSFGATVTAEQRFLVNEIQTYTAAAAYPTASGTFGLNLSYYGFEDFNEQRIGLAYARKLFSKFALGVQFDYLNTRITEYGSKGIFTFEVGILSQLFPELSLGVHVYSPVQIEIVEEENLPTIFAFGLNYMPSDKVSILAEVEKDIDFEARVKAGVEYQLVDALSLRVGVATNPTSPSFGLGYRLKSGLGIDVAASYHEVLGFTPAISVVFNRN